MNDSWEHFEAAVNPPLECTRDEAIARFYGEWILFQILEVDEYDTPTRGLVFAHSPDRGGISKVLRALPKRTKDQPFQPYYSFFGMPRAHVGETIEEALARFERQRAEVLSETGARQG
ncbi:MAG TPA: hypothetical protein VKB09_09020 [Thermomicrobiales bacterium]|nr:hypothetical protein [Thermomicrobiales bacterium]